MAIFIVTVGACFVSQTLRPQRSAERPAVPRHCLSAKATDESLKGSSKPEWCSASKECNLNLAGEARNKSILWLKDQLESQIWDPCGNCTGKTLLNTFVQKIHFAKPVYTDLQTKPQHFVATVKFCNVSCRGDESLGKKGSENSAAARMALAIHARACGNSKQVQW
mmetsp:Transcript_2467/g.3614  ORF Transcript_2467/g.3614 Transcript_2467/m.3614 type:complete len:166 (-) Transcript_2467:35-532(-)